MPKRKLVPTALHSEFTEYSSLIRALRTSNTLDVTSHIAKPHAGPSLQSREASEELNSDDDDSEREEQDLELDTGHGEDNDTFSEPPDIPPSTSQSRDTSPVSNRTSPLGSRKRKRKSTSPSRPQRRDLWTRWPLLADDVHIPEWGLDDEIGLLAATALKNQNRPPLPCANTSSTSDSSDSDDIDGDPSTYLPHLTNAATNYLSTILALLVAHTPNRPHSQQNRIEPIGWRAVLDILSSCPDPRIADLMIINNVKIRMEALFESSGTETSGETMATHRIKSSIAAKARLKSIMSGPMESLLTMASPQMP
ncbi:hypothetical protein BDZ94DRAFT_1287872 [Collybia nuda]|uniref:Uncharacterized protein n=1 Tax=Collybia nuda TaxID=64659 RepID=A0A9P5YDA8_9AGAR|nr:hypothetical protein BDZ94DRAFT_1287872 [Collybia nuda]